MLLLITNYGMHILRVLFIRAKEGLGECSFSVFQGPFGSWVWKREEEKCNIPIFGKDFIKIFTWNHAYHHFAFALFPSFVFVPELNLPCIFQISESKLLYNFKMWANLKSESCKSFQTKIQSKTGKKRKRKKGKVEKGRGAALRPRPASGPRPVDTSPMYL
jgi:hypothetical protein